MAVTRREPWQLIAEAEELLNPDNNAEYRQANAGVAAALCQVATARLLAEQLGGPLGIVVTVRGR